VPPGVTTRPRHAGRYAALVGRLAQGPAATSALTLSVTIPFNATAVNLSVYVRQMCGASRPRSRLLLTVEGYKRPGVTHVLLAGCGHGGWSRLAASVPPAAGRGVVVARALLAAREAAALILDDVRVTATVPLTAPLSVAATARPITSTPTVTATVAVTPTASSSVTATVIGTSSISGTTATTATTATPTAVPNTCLSPDIAATYLTALPTMTFTPTPRPNLPPAATPSGTVLPTRVVRRSNIPTPTPTATPPAGPTPGYTALPGPSATIGTTCHPVVKGISFGFVARDGGVASAATPAIGEPDAAALAALGARSVRLDLHLVHDDSWTVGEYSAYDAAVGTFCDKGIDILGVVGPGAVSLVANPSAWVQNSAERGGGTGDNAFLRLYAARVLELVGHYHRCVHSWELWNEPNVGGGNYLYPSNFAALLADTYALVKASYPDVTIVSGGLFSGDDAGHSTPRNAGADYLRQTYYMGLQMTHTWDAVRARFNTDPLDAVGQHLYLDQGGIVYAAHVVDAYRWMHDAYAAFGDGAKPLYMTEGAWSTAAVSPATQALDLDLLFSLSENPVAPYVARVYWYLLRDGDGRGGDQSYGLQTGDGVPKPALDRFAAYTSG